MNRLNRQQKDKVTQFRSITGSTCGRGPRARAAPRLRPRRPPAPPRCAHAARAAARRPPRSDKQAIECLKQAAWSVEGGIEVFFALGMQGSGPAAADTRNIEALYAKYKDAHHDLIMADGISRLCDDLGVEPTDIVLVRAGPRAAAPRRPSHRAPRRTLRRRAALTRAAAAAAQLVLSCHLNANIMCEYTRDEWVGGLSRLGVDSVDKLRAKLPELRAELRDPARFQEVYNFAFAWAREKGQKCLQIDTALAMWQLLYADERRWQYIDEWCEFLTEHHNRAISRDTWVQLFEFARQIKPDFSNFDEAGAWPYLMDEFVDFMKEKGGMAAAPRPGAPRRAGSPGGAAPGQRARWPPRLLLCCLAGASTPADVDDRFEPPGSGGESAAGAVAAPPPARPGGAGAPAAEAAPPALAPGADAGAAAGPPTAAGPATSLLDDEEDAPPLRAPPAPRQLAPAAPAAPAVVVVAPVRPLPPRSPLRGSGAPPAADAGLALRRRAHTGSAPPSPAPERRPAARGASPSPPPSLRSSPFTSSLHQRLVVAELTRRSPQPPGEPEPRPAAALELLPRLLDPGDAAPGGGRDGAVRRPDEARHATGDEPLAAVAGPLLDPSQLKPLPGLRLPAKGPQQQLRAAGSGGADAPGGARVHRDQLAAGGAPAREQAAPHAEQQPRAPRPPGGAAGAGRPAPPAAGERGARRVSFSEATVADYVAAAGAATGPGAGGACRSQGSAAGAASCSADTSSGLVIEPTSSSSGGAWVTGGGLSDDGGAASTGSSSFASARTGRDGRGGRLAAIMPGPAAAGEAAAGAAEGWALLGAGASAGAGGWPGLDSGDSAAGSGSPFERQLREGRLAGLEGLAPPPGADDAAAGARDAGWEVLPVMLSPLRVPRARSRALGDDTPPSPRASAAMHMSHSVIDNLLSEDGVPLLEAGDDDNDDAGRGGAISSARARRARAQCVQDLDMPPVVACTLRGSFGGSGDAWQAAAGGTPRARPPPASGDDVGGGAGLGPRLRRAQAAARSSGGSPLPSEAGAGSAAAGGAGGGGAGGAGGPSMRAGLVVCTRASAGGSSDQMADSARAAAGNRPPGPCGGVLRSQLTSSASAGSASEGANPALLGASLSGVNTQPAIDAGGDAFGRDWGAERVGSWDQASAAVTTPPAGSAMAAVAATVAAARGSGPAAGSVAANTLDSGAVLFSRAGWAALQREPSATCAFGTL
ncbi:Dcun1d1 [Scenedesmus sp. PABB004]|nr:Dcun1d1 [Scenedesmus sp. PABB004]